nr:SBBP repeat-containing protein [Candidatus Sigynarchaeota archaeon]
MMSKKIVLLLGCMMFTTILSMQALGKKDTKRPVDQAPWSVVCESDSPKENILGSWIKGVLNFPTLHTFGNAGCIQSGRSSVFMVGRIWNATSNSSDLLLSRYYIPDGFNPDLHLLLIEQTAWNGSLLPSWQLTGNGIASDDNGNVYIVGTKKTSSLNPGDALLVKYDYYSHPYGQYMWNASIGASGDDQGFGIAYHDGAVFITGKTYISGAKQYDMFLGKYLTNGTKEWYVTWGETRDECGRDVAVDGDGNIYVTGFTQSFGEGGSDAYLCKFSEKGVSVWNKTWGNTDNDESYGIALDTNDNAYISGSTRNASTGRDMAFLSKFLPDSTCLWNATWSNAYSDSGQDVSIDDLDRIFLAVSTNQTSGNNTISYVAQYYTNGSQIGADFPTLADINGIVVDNDGGVYPVSTYYVDSLHVNCSLISRLYYNIRPEITHPDDLAVNLGNVEVMVNMLWTISDDTINGSWANTWYRIYRNGSQVAIGSWNLIKTVDLDISRNIPGFFNYTIVANDGVDGSISDTVIVHVVNQDPVLSSPPPDFSYEYTTTGHSITWTINDSTCCYPIYEIRKNGTLLDLIAKSWDGATPITVSVDGLIPGIYNYSIWFDDGGGRSLSDSVIVTVFNAPPAIAHQEDITYAAGTIGHVITWNVIDNSLLTTQYVVLRNGMLVNTGSWSPFFPIMVGIDCLTIGNYNFTIQAWDGCGGQSTSSLIVHVIQDTTLRLDHPDDISLMYGSTGNVLSWTPAGSSANNPVFTIKRNSTQIATGIWTAGVPILITIDDLPPGHYKYTVTVWNGLGAVVEDNVTVEVIINLAPQITSLSDVSYALGTSGHWLNWILNDQTIKDPTWILYRDGSYANSGSWNVDTNVTVNIDGLDIGIHEYQIIATDGMGRSVEDEVLVTVLFGQKTNLMSSINDTMTGSSDDIFYDIAVDHEGNVCVVGASNESGNYDVMLSKYYPNGTLLWNITFGSSADDLGSSIAIDDANNIYVVGYTWGYNATGLPDVLIAKFTKDHVFSWLTTWGDARSDWGIGIAYFNNSIYITGYTRINSTNFDAILLKYTTSGGLIWNVTWGGSAKDLALGIAVNANGIYLTGQTSSFGANSLDVFLARFAMNNTLLWNVTWGGSGFDSGYRIVTDTAGNVYACGSETTTGGTEGFIVKYTPSYSLAMNITWSDGISERAVDLVLDQNGVIYTLCEVQPVSRLDTDVCVTRFLPNGALLDRLPLGTPWNDTASAIALDSANHGFAVGNKIMNMDYYENDACLWKFDIIPVNVNATISHLPDFSYVFTTTGHVLSWTVAGSINNSTYLLIKDGISLRSGTWTTGTPITANVDNLAIGNHIFVIIIANGAFTSDSDEINVNVYNPLPVILHPANMTVDFGTSGHSITWTITDQYYPNPLYKVTRNGTLIDSSSWISGMSITIRVDGYPRGTYAFIILVDDGAGEIVSNTVTIIVLSNQAPAITCPANTVFEAGMSGNAIIWSIQDVAVSGTSYTLLRNGTQVATGTWISGIPIAIELGNLVAGDYNFTLVADDGYGVTSQASILIMIMPQASPVDTASSLLTALVIITIANSALLALIFLYPKIKTRKTRSLP